MLSPLLRKHQILIKILKAHSRITFRTFTWKHKEHLFVKKSEKITIGKFYNLF